MFDYFFLVAEAGLWGLGTISIYVCNPNKIGESSSSSSSGELMWYVFFIVLKKVSY